MNIRELLEKQVEKKTDSADDELARPIPSQGSDAGKMYQTGGVPMKSEPPAPPVRPDIEKDAPPEEPRGEPEIDAPPIEETPAEEESWDDFDDGEEEYNNSGDGGSEGSGDGAWEDEDFAIPVALKEKLNKESQ